jgi:hypothetical protein
MRRQAATHHHHLAHGRAPPRSEALPAGATQPPEILFRDPLRPSLSAATRPDRSTHTVGNIERPDHTVDESSRLVRAKADLGAQRQRGRTADKAVRLDIGDEEVGRLVRRDARFANSAQLRTPLQPFQLAGATAGAADSRVLRRMRQSRAGDEVAGSSDPGLSERSISARSASHRHTASLLMRWCRRVDFPMSPSVSAAGIRTLVSRLANHSPGWILVTPSERECETARSPRLRSARS